MKDGLKPTKPEALRRREFLCKTMAASLAFAIPEGLFVATKRLQRPVRIALIADLHHDVMHDGISRMRAFLEANSDPKPDAIIQLGDFAYPNEKNREVIDVFNRAHDQSLHVIGNHDMDAGHTRGQCVDFWGMPGRHYVREIGGIRLLILDGNDPGSPTHKGGYASYIGEEQRNWLKEQLASSEGPLLIVSHQPLAGTYAVDNAPEIREILRQFPGKVLMAINGHSHIDSLVCIEEMHYLHINSASYKWVGGAFQHASYSEEVHDRYPWISYTCPYKDPLFAQLVIDPESRTITVEGRQSAWVGPSPAELGMDEESGAGYSNETVPKIRDRRIAVTWK